MGNSLFPLIYVAYKLLHQLLLHFSIDFWHKRTTPQATDVSQETAAFLAFEFAP